MMSRLYGKGARQLPSRSTGHYPYDAREPSVEDGTPRGDRRARGRTVMLNVREVGLRSAYQNGGARVHRKPRSRRTSCLTQPYRREEGLRLDQLILTSRGGTARGGSQGFHAPFKSEPWVAQIASGAMSEDQALQA